MTTSNKVGVEKLSSSGNHSIDKFYTMDTTPINLPQNGDKLTLTHPDIDYELGNNIVGTTGNTDNTMATVGKNIVGTPGNADNIMATTTDESVNRMLDDMTVNGGGQSKKEIVLLPKDLLSSMIDLLVKRIVPECFSLKLSQQLIYFVR
jgi:hypothetical protein